MFKKPIDPYKDYDNDEIEEIMDEFSKNDFDEDDEKAMIQAALLTLMPGVILACLAFAGIVLLVAKFFGVS